MSSSDLWNLWTLGIHAYQHRQVQDLQQNYIVKEVWSVKPAESPEMDPHRTISDSVAMWGTVPPDNHLWKDRIYIFQKLIKTDHRPIYKIQENKAGEKSTSPVVNNEYVFIIYLVFLRQGLT